ncbi:NTP transferase domain-containing protein [Arcicella sp. LKC2W]|uniref:NTP transferase domain-containing protein n=1 Tax=Arcicella sp. LKC2W TaxID=2984198 RepID=UPI002B1F1E32|nr:NTP transferase domain-containing protein [Arcicella sp. LKC2W]MEA5461039.1 NTP transferase domain-containing protein [Arcicella sp. LKC2W]
MNKISFSALILSGGLSSRMGEEKRLIHYHGKTQEQYLFDLLNSYCSDVYVSINQNQTTNLPHIQDLDLPIKSPMVGILSAFQKNPNMAWLVVACDMPFVDKKTIEFILQHRKPEKYATAFENPEEHFPEPLLTIYEPKIYPNLQEAVNQGKKSPMKILQSLDIELIKNFDFQWIKNINTVEERIKMNPF